MGLLNLLLYAVRTAALAGYTLGPGPPAELELVPQEKVLDDPVGRVAEKSCQIGGEG